MKLAITDACIFIELHNLRLSASFFKLDVEIHTTVDVFNELYDEQQDLLRAYEQGGKLHVHSVDTVQRIEILNAGYSRALSENDKTVLHMAKFLGTMILSSDKAVRNHAGKNAIECHGMLWIFDKLVENKILNHQQALEKLNLMVLNNLIYQHNVELTKEINSRISKWKKV